MLVDKPEVLEAIPVGSLWRRGSSTYEVTEHYDGWVTLYHTRTGLPYSDNPGAFIGEKPDFVRVHGKVG